MVRLWAPTPEDRALLQKWGGDAHAAQRPAPSGPCQDVTAIVNGMALIAALMQAKGRRVAISMPEHWP